MIRCQQVVRLLIDYVSEELDPDECSSFEAHLRECPACEAFVQSYRMTIQISRSLPGRPMPDSVVQRLQQVLNGQAWPGQTGAEVAGGRITPHQSPSP